MVLYESVYYAHDPQQDGISQCRDLSVGLSHACSTKQCILTLHTHPFNGPLSRTTKMSRYQKGKTNLDFTEARDSE